MFNTGCQDGDVQLLGNRPKIYVEGEWKFICTECFDKKQANKLCAVLGYEEGAVLTDASNITYTEQAEFHQPCNTNEAWSYSECSLICTSERFNKQNCMAGKTALRIECFRGFKNSTSSC